MKHSTMVGIALVILLLLVGGFLISPFSPLNKVNVDGQSFDLPTGYTVANSSKSGVTITNNTTSLSIYPTKENTTDLKEATKDYKNKYVEDFNVTVKKLNTTDSQEVYKTVATPDNQTVTVYWFNHEDKMYKIRSENADKDTDNIALKVISSMN